MSIIMLNVNGLNNQMPEIVRLDKTQDPNKFSLQETHIRFTDINKSKFKNKRMEKLYHTNSNYKGAAVVMLT